VGPTAAIRRFGLGRGAAVGHVVGEGDDAEARIRQIDELKYALRSLNMFRAVDPSHLHRDRFDAAAVVGRASKITIVPAVEHFSIRPRYRPTTRTQVESQLHNIADLSEHFLYSNDDMFFGRPLTASMFFSRAGSAGSSRPRPGSGWAQTIPLAAASRTPPGSTASCFSSGSGRSSPAISSTPRSRCVRACCSRWSGNSRRLRPHPGQRVSHQHRYLGDQFVLSLLRADDGRAVQHEKAKVRYVNTTTQEGLKPTARVAQESSARLLLPQRQQLPEVSAAERSERVIDFLERYFPIPAPWVRSR